MDTSTVGTYTVTYNVTDANGNKATEVTRTVNVVDTTVPVITLLGETPVTVEVGSTYTDAGVTASDNYDGNLTTSIVTVNSVDTSTVGTYTVTYNVTDANGNKATEVTRTVNVVDTTVPVITLLGETPVTVEVGSTYTDAGVTASDNYDGNLTTSIVTVNSVDTSTVGTYTVTYNVTDANGNKATEVTRTVNVVDTTAPTIATMDISVFSWGNVLNATEDNSDGTITVTTSGVEDNQQLSVLLNGITYTASISSNSAVVTIEAANLQALENAKNYAVTADVSDLAGNSAAQVTSASFNVDTELPVIALNGNASVTIDALSTYTDSGAIAVDSKDGNLTSSIVTVNDVNTSIIGSYTITYDVTDAAGNAAVQKTRTVIVVDTTAPEITGSENVNVNENETAVGTYSANESVTWSLSGVDSSNFSYNETSGALVFSSAPSYEVPTDSDSNNVYTLTLTATDPYGNATSVNISVTVVNVVEAFDSSLFSIQATTTTETTATINWTYSGDVGAPGVEGYFLWVRIGRGGSWGPVTVFNQTLSNSAGLTSYTLTGLTPDTMYAFRLWPIYDGSTQCKNCNGTGEPLFTTTTSVN